MESMNVADAKRRFSELLDRVAAGERFLVTRRGRPAAALVPPAEAPRHDAPELVGLLPFVGALADWPELDDAMREVVARRKTAGSRHAPDLE